VDYRLLFTQRALSDLSGIVGYIARDDAGVASRFGRVLLDHADLRGRFPRMGNTTRKRSRVRKLVHSPILVYYCVALEPGRGLPHPEGVQRSPSPGGAQPAR
jgi:plasmid stabilization system protein ParE